MMDIFSFWKHFRKKKIGVIGFSIILFFVLIAIFAPYLAPYNPYFSNPNFINQPPSINHPFGTNNLGEDVLSQSIYGSQISLIVGFTAAIISIGIGVLIGLFSGYYGGIVDEVLMRTTDFFLTIPSLVLMIIVGAIIGPSLINVILIIGLLGWSGTARTVRSMVLSIKEWPFIEAEKVIGAKNYYIIFRHIMPNVLPLIYSIAILSVAGGIFSQAALVFLGVGDVMDLSWGSIMHMAFEAGEVTAGYYWTMLFPGLFLILLILGFLFMAQSLEEIFNPKLRGRSELQ